MSQDAMDNRLRDVEIHLGRVEQRVEDHETDIRAFAALPMELAEIRFGQKQMQESLDAAHNAIRGLSGRLDREHEERVQGQADRKRELQEAREQRDAELERIRQEHRQEIVRREEAERQEAVRREDSERQQATLNREIKARQFQTLIGLAGIFLTSAGGVIVAILTGGGGG